MWCELCLAINANMSPLGDMELKLFIEKIFKQYGINKKIDVDDFACWGCKALLKKSYNFFQRLFKAQQELLNIMQTHKTVNLQFLNTIHRQKSSLDMNLSYKKISVDYFIYKDIEVEFIDDIQHGKPSTSPTDEVFEQNMNIDSVDSKTSVDHSSSVMGSISKIKNNVWSDTEKVGSDEDECYILSPRVATPSEHSSSTYSEEDPFNELAKTTENKNIVEANNSVPADFDPKKVNLLTDIEFTKMKKRRNVNSTRINYKTLLPSSSDTENSGNDRKKIKKNISRKSEDSDFVPEKASAVTTSESSEDCFDDEGKLIPRPKDRRVYPMQCENCKNEMFDKRMHYHHYLIYHPDIQYPYKNEKKYLCQYCGKGFGTPFVHKQHELTHSGKRAVQCPICPKKFLNSNQVVRHKYRVHNTLRFTCDYCGRNTKTREELIFHIRSHTGEKPYNCHICNAAFSHHAYRISHIKHAHGQNSQQTKISKPKALKQGKTKSEDTKRGRKKGTAKKDDSQKKEKNITKKRNKKKDDKRKSAMKETKVIPTEQNNIKEITTKKRMDSASSEDEILAFILNRKGPRQEMSQRRGKNLKKNFQSERAAKFLEAQIKKWLESRHQGSSSRK